MNNSKKRVAVALSYQETEDAAPVVSAIGEARLAEVILQIGRRYGIPIEEDSELASKLAEVGWEEEIPEELYYPVANILRKL